VIRLGLRNPRKKERKKKKQNKSSYVPKKRIPPGLAAETVGADQRVLKRRELPGLAIVNEKKRLHPWDTHNQFSIKTLLSQNT